MTSTGEPTLGHTQYGKAEVRVVRIIRADEPHDIHDYSVGISLVGDFDAAHTDGDNSNVLPTDTSKNTTFAFARRDEDVTTPEAYGLALARHMVDEVDPVDRARVTLEKYPWTRVALGGDPHPHTFVRTGGLVRTACVTVADDDTWVVSGLRDMTVLKTTDSEFEGFLVDELTSLEEARDRVLATTVTAQWLTDPDAVAEGVDWDATFDTVRTAMVDAFATTYSRSLQETVNAMGVAVLAAAPSVAEIRFSCPNSHHFLVDLEKVGIENPNEVFHADDRPYGLIEVTVRRADAPDPGPAAYDPGMAW